MLLKPLLLRSAVYHADVYHAGGLRPYLHRVSGSLPIFRERW
jgi:hypothetical protein